MEVDRIRSRKRERERESEEMLLTATTDEDIREIYFRVSLEAATKKKVM